MSAFLIATGFYSYYGESLEYEIVEYNDDNFNQIVDLIKDKVKETEFLNLENPNLKMYYLLDVNKKLEKLEYCIHESSQQIFSSINAIEIKYFRKVVHEKNTYDDKINIIKVVHIKNNELFLSNVVNTNLFKLVVDTAKHHDLNRLTIKDQFTVVLLGDEKDIHITLDGIYERDHDKMVLHKYIVLLENFISVNNFYDSISHRYLLINKQYKFTDDRTKKLYNYVKTSGETYNSKFEKLVELKTTNNDTLITTKKEILIDMEVA